MKKKLKLSLVAALAISSVSLVNAKPLTEAIQDVDVSGSVAYRYNDYGNGEIRRNNSTSNSWMVALSLSSKITDNLKINTRVKTGHTLANRAFFVDTELADNALDIVLSEANLSYTGVQNLTLTIGKQAIASPWTLARDTIGSESVGTGINAVYNFGPISFIGGFYNQTNFNSVMEEDLQLLQGTIPLSPIAGNDFYLLGATVNLGVISGDVYYSDLEDQFQAYTIGLNSSFDLGTLRISPFGRYSHLSPEENSRFSDLIGNTGSQILWQLGTTANLSIFDALLAYGKSGKNGGFATIDVSAQANLDYNWRVTAFANTDADYLYSKVGAQVSDKLYTALYYTSIDATNGDEYEYYARAQYQFATNLLGYVQVGKYIVDAGNLKTKHDIGRVHLQYTF